MSDETMELRELTAEEQRATDGGVTEGGCIRDPITEAYEEWLRSVSGTTGGSTAP